MKALMLIFAALFSTAAQADFARPITTDNLNCTGQAKGKPSIGVLIKSRSGLTTITIRQGTLLDTSAVKQSLTVQSEGNVYIQQVVNGSHNLFLTGPALPRLLSSGGSVNAQLKGTLDLFASNAQYQLTCKGVLSAAVDAQAR